jgi:hypothetical protein
MHNACRPVFPAHQLNQTILPGPWQGRVLSTAVGCGAKTSQALKLLTGAACAGVTQCDRTATDRATDATVVWARRRSVAARSTVTSPFSTDVATSQRPADAMLNDP